LQELAILTDSNQVSGRTLRVGEILRTGSCSAGKNLYKTFYGTSVRISCCTVFLSLVVACMDCFQVFINAISYGLVLLSVDLRHQRI
jgi:branched-subunit amino acid permease